MSFIEKKIYFIQFFWGLTSILLTSFGLNAKEIRYLQRSPRGLLMGDAYTSLVDDEYVLFYNPAAIGKSFGVYIRPINPQVAVTDALDDQDRFKDMPKDAAGVSDRLLGLPVYAQASATPGLRFGPVAFTLLANTSASIILRNKVHPFIDVDYRYDRGFVLGYAYSFGSAAKKGVKSSGSKSGVRTSIGLSVKSITREGLADSFSLFSPELMNQIANNSSNISEIKSLLGYSKGHGWGADIGVEHSISSSRTEITFGFSILDIAGTKFKKEEGVRTIPEQDMMVNTGISLKQDFTIFDYALSLDLHPLTEDMSAARKVHLGAKFGIPLINAYAGYNEGHLSYGLGFRFWPIEIIGGFYGVELGRDYKEEKGKRAIVYVSLLDFAFDIK